MATAPNLQMVRGEAIPAGALARDAREMRLETFGAHYGQGFLLVNAAQLHPGDGPQGTLVPDLGSADPSRGDGASATQDVAFSVYPLRKSSESAFPFISIGRTPNNDVVVRDATVSRFHAFVSETPDGSFQIQDAGSRNGTAVGGHEVPGQGAGDPRLLMVGDDVRIGSVALTFLDANGLHRFLRTLAG